MTNPESGSVGTPHTPGSAGTPSTSVPAVPTDTQATDPGVETAGARPDPGCGVSPPSQVTEGQAHPADAAPPSASAEQVHRGGASYALLGVVTFVALAADLATKWWAKRTLSGFDVRGAGPKHLEVIKDHLDFIFAQNPGGAWSFLRGLPEYLRRPFFLFISAAAIVFIVSIYRRVRPEQVAMKWGLPLALGGAVGNLVDRIRYGYVIDFIDVYVTRRGGTEHHWPTFNVADIAICIGVALMAIDMILSSRRARAAELKARDPGYGSVSSEPAPPAG